MTVREHRVLIFFFQAEDGIRDLVRSRGLGDVYKRQPKHHTIMIVEREAQSIQWAQETCRQAGLSDTRPPVSYTHLTLPTSDLV